MIKNNIYQYRTGAGLSQKEMAAQVGGSYRTIQDWEHDRRQPSTEQLLKLAHYFGCHVEDLVYLVPEEE